MLSYSIFFQQWSTRIQELGELGEELELIYAYTVIVRKLLFFDYVPEQLNDDLASFDFNFNFELPSFLLADQASAKQMTESKHLKAALSEINDYPGMKEFIEQYLSYS